MSRYRNWAAFYAFIFNIIIIMKAQHFLHPCKNGTAYVKKVKCLPPLREAVHKNAIGHPNNLEVR